MYRLSCADGIRRLLGGQWSPPEVGGEGSIAASPVRRPASVGQTDPPRFVPSRLGFVFLLYKTMQCRRGNAGEFVAFLWSGVVTQNVCDHVFMTRYWKTLPPFLLYPQFPPAGVAILSALGELMPSGDPGFFRNLGGGMRPMNILIGVLHQWLHAQSFCAFLYSFHSTTSAECIFPRLVFAEMVALLWVWILPVPPLIRFE
jgi:hypothetical protein